MEVALKADIIREIESSEGGRVLLHDEVADEEGNFEVVPVCVFFFLISNDRQNSKLTTLTPLKIWETLTAEDVLTPAEVSIVVPFETIPRLTVSLGLTSQ